MRRLECFVTFDLSYQGVEPHRDGWCRSPAEPGPSSLPHLAYWSPRCQSTRTQTHCERERERERKREKERKKSERERERERGERGRGVCKRREKGKKTERERMGINDQDFPIQLALRWGPHSCSYTHHSLQPPAHGSMCHNDITDLYKTYIY